MSALPERFQKYVLWHEHAGPPQRWQVSGEPGKGKRAMEVGEMVGTITFITGGGYMVVLRFSDGKEEVWNPHILHPAGTFKVRVVTVGRKRNRRNQPRAK